MNTLTKIFAVLCLATLAGCPASETKPVVVDAGVKAVDAAKPAEAPKAVEVVPAPAVNAAPTVK